jgi:hypothetical protein
MFRTYELGRATSATAIAGLGGPECIVRDNTVPARNVRRRIAHRIRALQYFFGGIANRTHRYLAPRATIPT